MNKDADVVLLHLKQSIARSRERIELLRLQKQELDRRARETVRQQDEIAWQKVQARLKYELNKWRGCNAKSQTRQS